jgi:hypothetical protein
MGDTKFVSETVVTQRDVDELRIPVNEVTETGDSAARQEAYILIPATKTLN